METEGKTGIVRRVLSITCGIVTTILLIATQYPIKPIKEIKIPVKDTLLLQVFEQTGIIIESKTYNDASFKVVLSKNNLINFLQIAEANSINDWKINFLKDGLELLSLDRKIKVIYLYEDLFPRIDNQLFSKHYFISYDLTHSYFQDNYIVLSYNRHFFGLMFISLILGAFVIIGVRYFSFKQYQFYKGRF